MTKEEMRIVLWYLGMMLQFRDSIIKDAYEAGISKAEIHRTTWIARTTIDRILEK